MALRAVVFDFGMVLTGLPDAKAHAQLLRLTGLSGAELEKYYWIDRHAYDEGKLTGFEFWQSLCANAGLKRSADEIEELTQWDARMWTTQDPAMVKWHAQLKERGLKTAVLSNMGDSVHTSIMRAFPWLNDFDVLVWSYELGYAKPDPRIYVYTLEKLGTRAGETLFVDDKAANVDAAQALGMQGLVYSTMENLKAELVRRGMDRELPLPG